MKEKVRQRTLRDAKRVYDEKLIWRSKCMFPGWHRIMPGRGYDRVRDYIIPKEILKKNLLKLNCNPLIKMYLRDMDQI
jgi:hypothetical protein